ncbi:MAG: hypothetical protein CMK59_13445 [Proteobacteria bacterium]|nr:hypothetical protein [Pseudomonadota bacterium]
MTLWILFACAQVEHKKCCLTDQPSIRDSGRFNASSPSTERDSIDDLVDRPSQSCEAQDAGFIDCSNLIEGNSSQKRYGIAVTDINHDGDFEAVVTGYGHSNQIWDWSEGKLIDITPESLKDPDRKAIGVAACDVDRDGKEEIYFLNVDQFGGLGEVTDRLYDFENGTWNDLFELDENLNQVNRFSGRSVACVDRLYTGQYGIFVANYGGPMKLFEVDNGFISDVGPQAGVDYTTGGRALVSLPIFEEGMHIFAGNEQGSNFMFQNKGDGTFSEIAAHIGIQDTYETVRGTTTLDIDDDGDFDLVYGNWEGPHRMWTWNGTSFEDKTPSQMQTASRIRTIISADFDNDGNEELFFNNIGEANRLFRRDAQGQWIEGVIGDAVESDGLGTGAAVLDLNGDGQLELLVAHGESAPQPLSLYRWPQNDNNYIRILPKTQHGAPARGAVVKVVTPSKTHLRQIDAGSGYLCQMEPVAHVGLGSENTISSIQVVWPDGTQENVGFTEINQSIVIEYPEE